MEKQDKKLFYLHELSNYTVDDGYPDVRGWKVIDKDGRSIGEVDDLIVNKVRERVVYLDVEVDDSILEANYQPYSSASENEGVHTFLNEDGENHLIIPIGLVVLDEEAEEVLTDKVDYQTFAETKRMKKHRPIDREYETQVLGSYNRENDYYPEDEYAEDEMFYERGEFKRRK